jgi:hypothetical protein
MRKVLLLIAMFGVCAAAVLAKPAMADWSRCDGYAHYCE